MINVWKLKCYIDEKMLSCKQVTCDDDTGRVEQLGKKGGDILDSKREMLAQKQT